MRKILASLLAITMLMTTMSVAVIPASAEDAAVVATGEFLETFDDYKTGVNWIEHMDTETGIVDATAIGSAKDAWTIIGGDAYNNANGKNTEFGNVEVVEYPADSGNMVLKLDTGTLPTGSWFKVRRNSNGANGLDRETEMNGKKMVIKAKFYYPKDMTFGYSSGSDVGTFIYDNGEYNFMWSSNYANDGKGHFGSTWNNTSWPIFSCMASYQSNYATKYSISIPDTWFDVKYVVDLMDYRTTAHPADTFRTFYDGWIGTATVGQQWTGNLDNVGEVHSKFPQPSTTVGVPGEKMVESFGGYSKLTNTGKTSTSSFEDYYGVSMHVGQRNTQNQYIYMDDVQVYYVDEFKRAGEPTFEKHNNNAWYAGDITIPFTTELADVVKEKFSSAYATDAGKTQTQITETTYQGNTYKNLFTLKDAEGKVVENGIANASVDGKNLIITPAIAADARNTTYTISASPLFMDKEGQGLNQFSDPTDILTFNTTVDPYANFFINEDFEGYTDTTSLWNKNLTNGYVTLDGVEKNAWRIGSTGTVADGIVKVSADPLKSGRGNVLEINNGTVAAGTNITVLRTPNGTSPVTKASLKGKRVVIEGDIYIPNNNNMEEDTVFAYYNNSDLKSIDISRPNRYILPYNSMQSTGMYVIGSGGNGTIASSRTKYYAGGKWHTYRYVIDLSKETSATHLDTVRGYIDGNLISAPFVESTGTDTPLEGYPIYEEDGVTPRKAVDFWKRGTAFSGNGTSWYSIGDFYGIFMANRKKSTNGTDNEAYYVDNMKAYYIDDLELTQPDLSNYTGGAISLQFNQEIADTDNFDVFDSVKTNLNTTATKYGLKDMFKIVDKNGNDIDGIKSVKLSADKKTVIIAPQNLEDNTDYTLVISRYFRDKEGQGLTKNSTEYEIPMSVGTVVAFTLKNLSQKEVSGFAYDRDVKITAEFSMNISEDMLTNGIDVTNSDGDKVAYGITQGEDGKDYGWTATINAENAKIVEFDFSKLPTDSYEVTTNENFAIAGEELSNTFNIKINAAAQPIVLFEETFDDYEEDGVTPKYTVNENWLDTATEVTDGTLLNGKDYTTSPSYFKSYTVNNNDWDIQLHWTVGANDTAPTEEALKVDDFIGVVDAPAGTTMTGKVLRIANDRATAYNKNYVTVRRNFDEAISLTEGKYAGKKLVFEADLVFKHGSTVSSVANHAMRLGTSTKQIYSYADGTNNITWATEAQLEKDSAGTYNFKPKGADWKNVFLSGLNYRLQEGSYAAKSYGPVYMWTTPNTTAYDSFKTGGKLTLVLDQTSEVDTMRMYYNGNLVTKTTESVLEGHARNGMTLADFAGSGYVGQEFDGPDTIYGIWNSAVDGEVFIDNFKAYLVDAFNIVSVTGNNENFNTVKGRVTYTFSKAVDKASVVKNDTVVLLDEAGKPVNDGIASAEVTDGGYQLTVKLSESLPGSTKYIVKLTDGIKDTDGLALSRKYYYYDTYDIDDHYTVKDDGTYDINVGGTTVNCTYTDREFAEDGVTVTRPATLKLATPIVSSNNSYEYESPIDCYMPDYSLNGMKTEVPLTTSLYKTVNATATAELNAAESKVVTKVTINNPEAEEMNIWAVVAVYGEYNEMLGCKIVPIDGDKVAAGYKTVDPIEVTVDGIDTTKVKSVKLHVWDSYEGMVPYHKAGTLWPQQPQQ